MWTWRYSLHASRGIVSLYSTSTRTTMKTKFLILVCLSATLLACDAEDETSPLWGIDYSSENASSFAMGSVDQFISSSKTVYIAKAAGMRCSGGNVFDLSYTFESGDLLELKILKKTLDVNFHFPGDEGENQLLSATFNGEVLNLSESKVTVEPRTEENKFATIAKLQTVDNVLFDGAITRVPLLK